MCREMVFLALKKESGVAPASSSAPGTVAKAARNGVN